MNPRFDVWNLPMFGNTMGMSAALTPYHDASVAAYCSTDAVGIQRPRLSVSLGPLSCSTGKHRAVRARHAVEVAAADRAADDEMMVAPRVVGADDAGAGAGRLQRAAEVRERERRDLTLQPELHRRVVERLDRLTDLRQQAGLRARPGSGACRTLRAGRRRSGGSGRAPATRR